MRHSFAAATCTTLMMLVALVALVAGHGCVTELDCALNGACSAAGVCVCDKGWTGPGCETLHLDPTPTVSYGWTPTSNTSSWGGGPPVRDPATGKYHLYVSEIAGSCGMSTWGRLSQSVHAVADAVEGPYARADTVVPTESHNTIYAYSAPDKTHLIYTIFDGISPASCNPRPRCTDGTTPGGSGLRPPKSWAPMTCPGGVGGRGIIHHSKSLYGPWTDAGPVTTRVAHPPPGEAQPSVSNPAPYVFPNGTVLLLGRSKDASMMNGTYVKDHNIWLFRADTWNSTYVWVPSNGVDGALNVGAGHTKTANGYTGPTTEDPVLYRGRRGFHVIFHSHPDLTHGWSLDGINWDWSPTISGPPNHLAVGGGDNERPRVALDENGDIDFLYVAQLGVDPAHTDGARTAAFRALKA